MKGENNHRECQPAEMNGTPHGGRLGDSIQEGHSQDADIRSGRITDHAVEKHFSRQRVPPVGRSQQCRHECGAVLNIVSVKKEIARGKVHEPRNTSHGEKHQNLEPLDRSQSEGRETEGCEFKQLDT